MAKVPAAPVSLRLELSVSPDPDNYIEIQIDHEPYESKLIERWEPIIHDDAGDSLDKERKALVLKELRRFQKNIDDEVEEFLKRLNR